MGLFDKIKDTGGKLSNLKDAGIEKVKSTLKDFENALPIIKKAGYNLNELNIGVGVPHQLLQHLILKMFLMRSIKPLLMRLIQIKLVRLFSTL